MVILSKTMPCNVPTRVHVHIQLGAVTFYGSRKMPFTIVQMEGQVREQGIVLLHQWYELAERAYFSFIKRLSVDSFNIGVVQPIELLTNAFLDVLYEERDPTLYKFIKKYVMARSLRSRRNVPQG